MSAERDVETLTLELVEQADSGSILLDDGGEYLCLPRGELRLLVAEVARLTAERERLDEIAVWAETLLARHDAFLQQQTPEIAYAMRDAADGLRAALTPQAEAEK